MAPDKPNEPRDWRSHWRSRWPQWRVPLQRTAFAGLVILTALAWYYWPDPVSERVYEVYARTTYSSDETADTAEDMRVYLSENFPPGDFEFIGIIAQRLPTSQSPSTTTYVLFRRK